MTRILLETLEGLISASLWISGGRLRYDAQNSGEA